MSSEVQICNLALSHLGDTATVTSLDPPEGSAQAEHCARFYPIARDMMLEAHAWGFATRRTQPAQLTSEAEAWEYAYAIPNNALRILEVFRPGTPESFAFSAPQNYTVESLADGARVLYTDAKCAQITYTVRVTDTTKFSPLFVMALSWQLAALLAGPLIKGAEGAAAAQRASAMMMSYASKAMESDANQRHIKLEAEPPWMAGRSLARHDWPGGR